MSTGLFLQLLLNGLMLAGIYGLLSVGLNLIFGVMRVLNFAHGEIIMIGGYTAFWLFTLLGLTPLWSLPLALPAFFLLGMAIQRLLITPLIPRRAQIEDTSLVMTYGLSLFLASFARFLFSVDYRSVSYMRGSLFIGDMVFSYAQIAAFTVALVLTVLLFLFLKATRVGMAIRATAQNRELASACGIESGTIYMVTFGLGAATAGAAGSIFSLLFAVYPEMGLEYSLRAFVIVILGGMGNLPGALVGALVLAMAETFVGFLANAQLAATIPFVLVILILLLRPGGLTSGSDR
ncbi:MAG: branched-chain amino acid ABC transporter permease [Alphaproteobacteria bacterium]|nr:branched-chain amino acid ABC transporter permease [Alphaproteobacteria bacterium]